MYRPGCLEHYALYQLRNDPDFVPELNFVMEQNGKIIGQVVYVKAKISADDGKEIPIMTMGYFVDEKDAEEFDKSFPPKEKRKLPGQLF